MNTNLFPKEFKDKNGRIIKAGDILIHKFKSRVRESPGHTRAAIEGMSGNDIIISDEGCLMKAKKQWVTYQVKWAGACLIAEMQSCSNFQIIVRAQLFDMEDKPVHVGLNWEYFNNVFDSSIYEVIEGTIWGN